MSDKRKVNGLIEFCKSKVGTPYVYGAKGEILTEQRIQVLKKQNPGMYTSTYVNKARKFIGQRCTDCSGLISWYTGIIRGSYNYHDTADQRVAIGALDESRLGGLSGSRGMWGPILAMATVSKQRESTTARLNQNYSGSMAECLEAVRH